VARGLVELVDAWGAAPEIAASLRDALDAGDESWLPARVEDEFWDAASDEAALRDFAVLATPAAPPGSFGAVELAALSAPDVRHALRTLASTSDVLHGTPIFDLAEREDGSAALVYRCPHDRASAGGAMAAEMALSSAVELLRRATAEDEAAPLGAYLIGEPHARPRVVAQALRCPVHTCAVVDRLELSPELLDTPSSAYDPRAHRLAMRLVALERARALPRWTSAAARGVVRGAVESGVPVLDEIARASGLSPRATRMRLAEDATKLRALVDDARRAVADRMLLSGASPTEIHRALGYADLASLRRACRRWWGMGPLARAELLAPRGTHTRPTRGRR
jgi:AraC-like DNA-binding protein